MRNFTLENSSWLVYSDRKIKLKNQRKDVTCNFNVGNIMLVKLNYIENLYQKKLYRKLERALWYFN